MQETWLQSMGQNDPLEEEMATHSSILAWKKSHGQRSLVGHSPWGCKELDMTEELNRHISLAHTLLFYHIFWDFPFFIKPSIKILRFNCFFGVFISLGRWGGTLYHEKKKDSFRYALTGGCWHGETVGRLTRSRESYVIDAYLALFGCS